MATKIIIKDVSWLFKIWEIFSIQNAVIALTLYSVSSTPSPKKSSPISNESDASLSSREEIHMYWHVHDLDMRPAWPQHGPRGGNAGRAYGKRLLVLQIQRLWTQIQWWRLEERVWRRLVTRTR
jgi:hypothetical protein